jgi:hypothetical protein
MPANNENDETMSAPEISSSTAEERRQFVIKRFECQGDCDLCGNCSLLHGRDPQSLYDDYIAGRRSFMAITMELRR